MTVHIEIVRRALSDGSFVFDVVINDAITLPAITERDANHLQDKLQRAIDEHANAETSIGFWEEA